ncbi:MAG: family 43 glycosylhydrolase [Candidatus Kerfeldbacteria bacterium]|nr:family 43 glycosylhydrolase [Candidatus Kerfeldbacteria bacterium]
MRRYQKHILSVLLTFGVALSAAGVLGPFSSNSAEAVVYTPLNNQRAKDFAIIRHDGTWHVFAIWCDLSLGCDAQRRGLMHLTSVDLKNWTEVGFVLAPDGGSDFDDYDIWAPSVIERDGTFYMYYTGVYKNGSNTLVQKIGLATSTDLNSWTKYSTTPVLDCSIITGVYYNTADSSDGAACRDANVIWDETEHQWVMAVSSRRTGSTPANIMSVALATSEDLVTWREYGFIPATDDYITESAHIFSHAGTYYMVFTENGSGTDYIDYLTSTNLYTGWTRIGDLSPAAQFEYASEYIADSGHEYFARIDATNVGIDFDEIVWSGTPFTIQDPQYATIGDAVWADANEDGIYDVGESGIDNVSVKLYLDDGDGLFDVGSDDLYRTVTTGDDPNTVGTQHGYFRFTDVLPDTYWVSIDPSNYQTGNALAGLVATTANTVTSVTVTDNQAVTTVDVGFGPTGTAWSLSTGANFSVNSEATLSNGRATSAANSDAIGWWNANWQYRRQVTVTANSEALTTAHTVDMTYDLSSLVGAGQLQADFDDLRVVYWNGSANVVVPVDVIDGDTYRFKIQSAISAGNNNVNYFLYYGNPDADTYHPNLAQVYDYYASFNSKDQASYGSWTESTNDWNIVANRWKFTGTPVSADRFTRDTGKTINLTDDWNLEATANIDTGQIGALAFHSLQAFGNEEYHLNLDATNNRFQLFHWAMGQVGSNVGYTFDNDIDYRVRLYYNYINLNARSITAYVNGVSSPSASFVEGVTGYDIWYPDNSDDAYPALGVFNSQTAFNDFKGWQASDMTVSVGTENQLYPTRTGTVTPISGQAVSFGKLTEFRASVLEQSGAVRFILSNDGGTTWLYHNGTSWVSSNGTSAQANTAAQVNTNAGTFPAGGRSLLWRAILTSSGNQFPTLLQVGASVNVFPSAPTLQTPTSGSSVTTFRPTMTLSGTDPEGEALQYEIQVDTTNSFDSANLQTYAQSTSQTGWSGQDALSGSAYTSGTTATFTLPVNLGNTTYYWRARTIDPAGSAAYSSYAVSSSFSTPAALVISGLNAANITANAATISWSTSAGGTTQLEYGLTTAYGTTTTEETALATQHSVALSGLISSTTYHFRAISRDAGGNISRSADGTFTTTSSTVISNIRVIAGETIATIMWTTNELATSKIRYGSTPALGQIVSTPTTTTSHQLKITSLTAGTVYYYQLESVGSNVGNTVPTTFTTNTPSSRLNRAIGPTLFKPLIHDGPHPTVTIIGLARGGDTVRIHLDSKVVKTIKLRGTPAQVKPFFTRVPLDDYQNGRHTLYAQSTDTFGRTSYVARKITFVLHRQGSDRGLTAQLPREYVVAPGDSWWILAERHLSDGRRYPEIIKANQEKFPILLLFPLVLRPGWVIVIPAT